MDELKDEASASHAQLQSGHRVRFPAEARTPLDIEPHDQAVESTAVNAFDVGDPGFDDGRRVCDHSYDLVVKEANVVDVVGIGRYLSVANAYRHLFDVEGFAEKTRCLLCFQNFLFFLII